MRILFLAEIEMYWPGVWALEGRWLCLKERKELHPLDGPFLALLVANAWPLQLAMESPFPLLPLTTFLL